MATISKTRRKTREQQVVNGQTTLANYLPVGVGQRPLGAFARQTFLSDIPVPFSKTGDRNVARTRRQECLRYQRRAVCDRERFPRRNEFALRFGCGSAAVQHGLKFQISVEGLRPVLLVWTQAELSKLLAQRQAGKAEQLCRLKLVAVR